MSHLSDIYAVWGHNAEAMAADISEAGVKVRQWRNRGNIPPEYWQRIIDAAAAKGVALQWNQFVRPIAEAVHAVANSLDRQLPSAGKSENNTAQRVAA